LKLALAANPQNVRATILSGDAAEAAGDPAAAIGHWKRVDTQNPAYLPLVADKLMKAYIALGKPADGAEPLMGNVDRYPSNDLLDIAYQHIAAMRGQDAAHALARAQMEKSPNLSGMLHLLDAQIAAADEPRRKELEMMRALIRQRTKNLPRYTCQNCGFRARLFYRQCPVAAAGKPMRRGASNLRCRADPGERRRWRLPPASAGAAKLVNRDVPEHL
jgi:lipopolysaccharide biosynthesis regulator YciM